jgi:hypothetical protein
VGDQPRPDEQHGRTSPATRGDTSGSDSPTQEALTTVNHLGIHPVRMGVFIQYSGEESQHLTSGAGGLYYSEQRYFEDENLDPSMRARFLSQHIGGRALLRKYYKDENFLRTVLPINLVQEIATVV